MSSESLWYRIAPGGFVTYPRELGLCSSLVTLLQQPEVNQVPTAIVTDASNISVLNSLLHEELPADMIKSYGAEDDEELNSTLLSEEGGLVIFDSASLVYSFGLVSLIQRSKCKVFIMVGWSDCHIMHALANQLREYRSYCIRPSNLRETILSYLDEKVDELPQGKSEHEHFPCRSVGAHLARGEELCKWRQLGILPDLCTYDYVCDWVEGLCQGQGVESLKVKFYSRNEDEYVRNHQVIQELDYIDRVYQALKQRSYVIA